MGFFANPLRSRKSITKLPIYEKQDTGSSPLVDGEESYDETSSDYDSDPSEVSQPSTPRRKRHSRQSSASMCSPKSPLFRRRRSSGFVSYRLPNRITRYLCAGVAMTIIIFIGSLVRASSRENARIAVGDVDHGPPVPNAWESFEFLTRYYGGVRTLVPFASRSAQYPRAEDEKPLNDVESHTSNPNSAVYEVNNGTLPPTKAFATDYPNSVFSNRSTQVVECYLDEANTIRVPLIRYFDGRSAGFPDAVLGSYDVLSLPEDICYDRHGRYGPYGFGQSVRNGGLGVGEHGDQEGAQLQMTQADWSGIDWANVQRRCYQANAARFKSQVAASRSTKGFQIDGSGFQMDALMNQTGDAKLDSSDDTVRVIGNAPRTAIVIRTWDEFPWLPEHTLYLRSIIAEAALASGARYDVHLLVQVKNDGAHPIWADDQVYLERIRDSVPQEFQNIVTLWTETQMLSLYQGVRDLWTKGPNLPVHGVYRGLQMAMQYFAHQHTEYDYFWQWEMDIRYTGHYLELFTRMEDWSLQQPRKGLWERNERFYLPSEHGTWEDFKQMARVQAEMGTVGADNIWNGVDGKKKVQGNQMVWGPLRAADSKDWFEPENDPVPPTSYEHDKYQWGVGEEADLITLNPMFDPADSSWGLAEDITGFNESAGTGKPPRRAHIITASRMSRKLLLTMHRETAFKKHHAFPEMWPATVALHHGYKAVFVPHPVYVDREWPTQYMARIFNGGKNGASGGARTSVFGQREHNLQGLSWFYNSGFAPNLYKRWLGLKINNDGGEEFELIRDMSKNGSTVGLMRGGEGRMCLPPMLLHPIKHTVLPVEEENEAIGVPESDPAA